MDALHTWHILSGNPHHTSQDGRRRNDRCYFNISLLNIGFTCTGHIWWMGASSFSSQGCAVHKRVDDCAGETEIAVFRMLSCPTLWEETAYPVTRSTSQVIHGLYSYNTVDCSKLLKIQHAKDAILDPHVRMWWPNRRQANVSCWRAAGHSRLQCPYGDNFSHTAHIWKGRRG